MLNVPSSRQSPPQGAGFGASCFASLGPDAKRCRKRTLQPNVVDLREVLSQNRLGGFILVKNGRAQFQTRPPEEFKMRTFFVLPAETIEFVGNGKHAEPIRIVPRHGKAEHC